MISTQTTNLDYNAKALSDRIIVESIKNEKKLLKSVLLIVCLLSSITTSAYDFESDGIYYNITSQKEKTVEVSRKEYYSGDVVIPASVTNGETTYSVTSIGKEAFYDCRDLKSVVIPNSVTEIGQTAFYDCSSLTSIEIPNSVTEIGPIAFWGCSGLKKFIVDSKNNNYSALDGVLFNKDKTTIVAFPYAKSPIYAIPNSVTNIGGGAFASCLGFTSVTIPNSVTSVSWGAFANCKSLSSVTIPNSVTEIGGYAFYNCASFTSVAIPNSVTSISQGTFAGCKSLSSVTIPNSVTEIGQNAFDSCSSLRSVEIPNSVTSISVRAFSDCSGLTSVTIPNSVMEIYWYAFEGCSGLTNVTIPNSVTGIGAGAFRGCEGLTRFIVDSENNNYIALDGVLFNKDKTTIVSYPNAKSRKYTIPKSVTDIGQDAFYGCDDLTSVTIPNSVTKIGDDAFYNCTGLKRVTIPKSVTEIGNDAFNNCTSLTSVTIPNSVTKIENFVFFDCTSLKEIHNYSEKPQPISDYTFDGVNKEECVLYVPKGTMKAYKTSDYWKEFLYIKEFQP